MDFIASMNRSHSSRDRKSTRLNSSHGYISYAVFCLKKKKIYRNIGETDSSTIRVFGRPVTCLQFALRVRPHLSHSIPYLAPTLFSLHRTRIAPYVL